MEAEYKPLVALTQFVCVYVYIYIYIYIYIYTHIHMQLLTVTGYRLNLIMPAISVPHPTAILVRQGLTSSFATNHLRPLWVPHEISCT